jgi:hypothetical protein
MVIQENISLKQYNSFGIDARTNCLTTNLKLQTINLYSAEAVIFSLQITTMALY